MEDRTTATGRCEGGRSRTDLRPSFDPRARTIRVHTSAQLRPDGSGTGQISAGGSTEPRRHALDPAGIAATVQTQERIERSPGRRPAGGGRAAGRDRDRRPSRRRNGPGTTAPAHGPRCIPAPAVEGRRAGGRAALWGRDRGPAGRRNAGDPAEGRPPASGALRPARRRPPRRSRESRGDGPGGGPWGRDGTAYGAPRRARRGAGGSRRAASGGLTPPRPHRRGGRRRVRTRRTGRPPRLRVEPAGSSSGARTIERAWSHSAGRRPARSGTSAAAPRAHERRRARAGEPGRRRQRDRRGHDRDEPDGRRARAREQLGPGGAAVVERDHARPLGVENGRSPNPVRRGFVTSRSSSKAIS